MIYDLTGKLAANLFEGRMYPGIQTLTFNASDLARGIYIGKIVTENKEYTLKMLVK